MSATEVQLVPPPPGQRLSYISLQNGFGITDGTRARWREHPLTLLFGLSMFGVCVWFGWMLVPEAMRDRFAWLAVPFVLCMCVFALALGMVALVLWRSWFKATQTVEATGDHLKLSITGAGTFTCAVTEVTAVRAVYQRLSQLHHTLKPLLQIEVNGLPGGVPMFSEASAAEVLWATNILRNALGLGTQEDLELHEDVYRFEEDDKAITVPTNADVKATPEEILVASGPGLRGRHRLEIRCSDAELVIDEKRLFKKQAFRIPLENIFDIRSEPMLAGSAVAGTARLVVVTSTGEATHLLEGWPNNVVRWTVDELQRHVPLTGKSERFAEWRATLLDDSNRVEYESANASRWRIGNSGISLTIPPPRFAQRIGWPLVVGVIVFVLFPLLFLGVTGYITFRARLPSLTNTWFQLFRAALTPIGIMLVVVLAVIFRPRHVRTLMLDEKLLRCSVSTRRGFDLYAFPTSTIVGVNAQAGLVTLLLKDGYPFRLAEVHGRTAIDALVRELEKAFGLRKCNQSPQA